MPSNPFGEIIRLACELTGLHPASVSRATPYRSLKAVHRATIILAMERTFHITIHDEDILSFQTLGDVSDYVEAALADGREDYSAPTDKEREGWFYR